jgi:hypothetical protein
MPRIDVIAAFALLLPIILFCGVLLGARIGHLLGFL